MRKVLTKRLLISAAILLAFASSCISGHAELKTEFEKIQIDSQPVTALTFSPDGNRLVSGSKDGTIRFWDMNTFEVISRFNPHDRLIEYQGISLDGKFLMSSSDYEKIMELWSTETGKLIKDFGKESAGHRFIAFSSDGKIIATQKAYPAENILFWSVETGRAVGQLDGFNRLAHGAGVMFTPDSKYFICQNSLIDRKVPGITVWEVDSGKLVASVDGYRGVISHPDSDTIATISPTQKEILFFSIKEKQVTRTFCIPECRQITDYQFTTDGKYLLVNTVYENPARSFLHKVIVVDLDGLKPIYYFNTNPELDYINCQIAFNSAMGIFAVALKSAEEGICVKIISSNDGKVIGIIESYEPLDKETREKIPYTYYPQIPEVQVLGISPDAEFLVTFYRDKDLQQIRIWSLKSNKLINSINAQAPYYKIAFLDNNNAVLTASDYLNERNDFHSLSLKTGKIIRSFIGIKDGIRELHFSADGRTLISTGGDNTIRVLDVPSGKAIQTIVATQSQIHHAVVSSDGETIVYIEGNINDPENDYWVFQPLSTYASQMQLKVWSIESGCLIKTIQTYPYPITEIEMLPDGETVACFHTSPDVMEGEIKFWSIKTGEQIKLFGGDLNVKSDIALSASGKYMASTSYHNNVRIWDLSDDRLFITNCITGHDIQVLFNYDETLVASCDYDRVSIISIKNKRELDWISCGSYGESGISVYCTSFALSPIENVFATGLSNGEIELTKII